MLDLATSGPEIVRFPPSGSPRRVRLYDFQYFGARGAFRVTISNISEPEERPAGLLSFRSERASLFARRERPRPLFSFVFTVFGAQIEGALILGADLTV